MAGRGQGAGSATLFVGAIIALALLAGTNGAMAATYTVGDAQGWNTGVSFSAWAAQYTFKVGDTLKFNYNPEMHSVFQVSEADYKACNLFPAINTYQTGSDSITLSKSTTYYFVCGTPGHCSQGMALEVTIGGSKQATPSPAPLVAPAPVSTAPAPALPKSPTPSPAPKKAPAPAPDKVSPSTSPISPSPSEAISPSTEATSPSSSSTTFPPSEAPAPSVAKSAVSALQSSAAGLLSATLLGGYILFF